MQVTSNFDMQKKDYYEVAPHNHRIKNKTKNNNIDWSLTKYDILNQHLVDFKQLMIDHWGIYAFTHDLKRIKSGHINDTYGDYSRPELRTLQNKVLNSMPSVKRSYKLFKKNLPQLQTKFQASELLKSIQGMFQRKNKVGYRTIETGFARGTNHKKQLGSDRREIWKRIKRAYPKLDDKVILQSEAKGLNQVPHRMNKLMPGFKITDYDVHVDEKKNYFGQAHLQGRMALLGKTKKGKPSFNLNNAIQASVAPHQELLKQLDKKYYPKNYGTKKDHMNFHNNVGRFHAFNMLASYITFQTEGQQLEHDFPKANLDFSLIRTYSPSVSHDEYIRQHDQKRQEASSVDRATKKARQHLQKSYASSQAAWLAKQKASISTASVKASASASTKDGQAQSIKSSAANVVREAISSSTSASQAVSKAWANIHQHEASLGEQNINLLTRFMTVTQTNNQYVKDNNYRSFANDCYKGGLTYPNWQVHSGYDLMTRQQSEATSLINQRFSNVAERESANARAISSANHISTSEKSASVSISSAASSVANDSKGFADVFTSFNSFQNSNINKLSSLYGSSEVTMYGVKTTTDVIYEGGLDVNNDGHLLSQADLVDYLIKQRQKKRKKELEKKQKQLDKDKQYIRKFKAARRKMMRQQFSLIVPKSYQVKGESRQQMIDDMAQGIGFKGTILGDDKFHSGFDLEVHFVGYDLQHGLDANVQEAKNETDDYQKNLPKRPRGFTPSDSDDTPPL